MRTYRGSCHCKAVEFEADIDLANSTSRCNCSICSKLRLWKLSTSPDKVRLLRGDDAMKVYRFGKRQVAHQFCSTCGTKLFGRGEADGKPFVVVSIAALDDASDEELAAAKITYQDGRHDAFDHIPAVTSYM